MTDPNTPGTPDPESTGAESAGAAPSNAPDVAPTPVEPDVAAPAAEPVAPVAGPEPVAPANPYAQSNPYAAGTPNAAGPGYVPPAGVAGQPAGYGAYPAQAPAKTPLLSILSLVAGIIAFVGGFIVFIPFVGSILGLPFPIAAIILGFLGKKKEPNASKGFWLTGIILGFVGLATALIGLVLWIVVFAAGDAYSPYGY